jgi:NADH:ubiquinone oxidoreductase subunit E
VHELEICLGPECGACGGSELLKALRAMPIADTITIHGGHCQGLCHEAPVASLDDALIAEATPDTILQRLNTATS